MKLKTLNNIYLCARRVFFAPSDIKAATLRITADARYFLFINGERVGNGPIRGWQHSWFYDTYDLTPHLKTGVQNVLGVLAWQPGETTFQYPLGRGGLLAQLDITTNSGQEITIATDRNWLVKINEVYDRRTPRISVQQGFVEHYDATKDSGWTTQSFDDSNWAHATELGDVGVEPWEKLAPRSIPFLTNEACYPVRVMRTRVVKPPRVVYSFDLRPSFLEEDRSSNVREITGIVLTVIRVPEAREVKVTILSGAWLNTYNIRVNGEDVSSVERNSAVLKLRAGENLVAFDVTASYHDWWFTTIWDADLEFRSPVVEGEGTWATAGPFSSRGEEGFQMIWNSKSPEDVKALTQIRPVSIEHTASDNAFARTVFSKELEEKARVEYTGALCLPNEDVASIYPAEQGDVELLVDFGREVVGFLDFEVSAPKNVILDFYGFEAIH
ncbi:MAG: alpha-L-rhamnosidase N-terminal domain-containing protein, partial [Candidatus Bathyarchaeia archaeon]